jgi:tRNA modification GTPase
LSDTAGIRETSDTVEQIGVARAREHFGAADIRLHVTDNDRDAQLLLETTDGRNNDIVVRNKIDVQPSALPPHERLVPLSCVTGVGVARLLDDIVGVVRRSIEGDGSGTAAHSQWPVLTRERHRTTLAAAQAALRNAIASTSDVVVVAEELRTAARLLGPLCCLI